MARMTLSVIDDRGTYNIPPGQRRQPWSVCIADERASSHGDWSFDVEELIGWSNWTWAVTINGHAFFVNGEDRPEDPGL